ncbi:hypothetical protein Poly59_13200 [Rubripirellula reticaptiva]|uniref:Uncharacterized protein n=1 Tax=Rubripirellula reticaptiva TaxID=2528013 RepID=A0A5C6F0W3_9BACT|nr:hypothetical protein Poly59_13200 [Rubripirellula reticaptiva]
MREWAIAWAWLSLSRRTVRSRPAAKCVRRDFPLFHRNSAPGVYASSVWFLCDVLLLRVGIPPTRLDRIDCKTPLGFYDVCFLILGTSALCIRPIDLRSTMSLQSTLGSWSTLGLGASFFSFGARTRLAVCSAFRRDIRCAHEKTRSGRRRSRAGHSRFIGDEVVPRNLFSVELFGESFSQIQ